MLSKLSYIICSRYFKEKNSRKLCVDEDETPMIWEEICDMCRTECNYSTEGDQGEILERWSMLNINIQISNLA